MHTGAMDSSTFTDLVRRNAYVPGKCRFLKSRWGERSGAPPGTATFIYGRWWDQDSNSDKLRPDYAETYNFPVPSLPERTRYLPNGRVEARGWKWLIQALIRDRVLRPSEELRELLGDRAYEEARKWRGGCW